MSTTQEQFNGAVRESQEVVAQSVRAWQEAVRTAANTMAQNVQQVGTELPGVGAAHSVGAQLVDSFFDFAEQLLATQRQFAKSVLESGMPTLQAANASATSATEAAQRAATESARAVQDAASKTADSASRAAKK